jgi:hypothetical protein
MADDNPLSDNAAPDRLYKALETLGEAPGASVHADTALRAHARAVTLRATRAD